MTGDNQGACSAGSDSCNTTLIIIIRCRSIQVRKGPDNAVRKGVALALFSVIQLLL